MPFDPQGFSQEIQRQAGGVRALLLNQLQRKQAIQDLIRKAQIEQQIKMQDPLQQLLQQGQAAQAIQNIANMGGDVSAYRNLFGGGGTGVTQPTPAPTPSPIVAPSAQAPIAGADVEPTAFEIEKRPFSPQFGKMVPTKFEPKKGLAGESAAKLTMINQALSDLEGAEKQLFTPEGKFKRGLAFAANIPGGRAFGIGRLIPDVGFGTGARVLNSRMNNALEAKLRIETGAAATQEEFNRLQTRFGITGFDTPESARNKLTRLKDFMRNAIITIDPSGRFTYKTKDEKLDKELNVDIPQLQSLGLDPNRYEIVGEE